MTPNTLLLIDALAASSAWPQMEELLQVLERDALTALSIAGDMPSVCNLQGQVLAYKRLLSLPDEAKKIREARVKASAMEEKNKEEEDAKRRRIDRNSFSPTNG